MNLRSLLFIACSFSFALTVQAQNTEYFLSWDLVAVDGVEGMTTNRLYLNTVGPDDFLTAVVGLPDELAVISTTTTFYQNETGGVTPNSNIEVLFEMFEGLEYDSWVTIGIDQSPVGLDLEMEIATIPPSIEAWVLPFETGGDLVIDDGAWYILPGSTNGIAGDDLKVLIGQFTTDGTITGSLTFQVFADGSSSTLEEDLHTLTVPERGPDAVSVDNLTEDLGDWSLSVRADASGRCEMFGWPQGAWQAEAWGADGKLLDRSAGYSRGGQISLGSSVGVALVRVVSGGQVRVVRLLKGE